MVSGFANKYEELFYGALRIRMVEQRVIDLYPSDKIQSPVHLSIGQEPVAVGLCDSLRIEDPLFCSYRSHAFYLAKGGDLREMFAELYGKITGCGAGKAGSMHLAYRPVGLMGSSAVVASTIPHAVGSALASKIRGLDQVSVAVFGDGATEEGVYHESLNFAQLHQLPVVFVCENNGLAVHSPLTAREAYKITEHASSYGLPTRLCESGHDLLEVHEAFASVVNAARRSGGPQFIEVRTFRYMEHVGPGEDYEVGYRFRRDLEAWMSKDPLVSDTALVEKFKPQIEAEIDEAVDFAESSPWPGREELLTDVI